MDGVTTPRITARAACLPGRGGRSAEKERKRRIRGSFYPGGFLLRLLRRAGVAGLYLADELAA